MSLWTVVVFLGGLCLCLADQQFQSTANLRVSRSLWRADPADVGDAVVKEAEHNTDTVYRRIMNAPEDLPRDARRDQQLLKDAFLPGYKPNMRVLSATFSTVLFACAWFTLYFGWIYTNDRVIDSKEELDRVDKLVAEKEKTMLGGWLSSERFVKDCMPDMVVAFPHPGHASHTVTNDADIAKSQVLRVLKESRFVTSTSLKGVIADDAEMLNAGKIRASFMQDLLDSLPKLGFHIDAFTSVDGDEIFFCITLDDEEMIEHYLVTSHGELQLQPQVIGKLGVGDCQDPAAVNPPWVRFDRQMVQQLAKCGILEEDDPRNLFITHKGRCPKGCLLTSQERFRTIYRHLSSGIDFDTAKKCHLLSDWYPAHNLLLLQRFAFVWGCFGKLKDLSFKQPISMINEYFGTRVSFIFAWNGVYCKALLALVPLALMWEGAGKLVPFVFSSISPNEASRQVLGMTIIVLVWAKIASNLYEREEEFFMKKWGLNKDLKSRIIRPEYQGTVQSTPHDSNLLELQASTLSADIKLAVSGFITLLAVMLVAFAIFIWVAIFDGNMNLLASICLTIQIKIFEVLFNILAGFLTEWENHKFPDSFYNSYLLKQFLFAFVNSYWAFLYLAIKQRHTESGCPAGGCLWVMRKQLSITLIILSVLRIVAVTMQTFTVRFNIWLEDRSLKKELGVEELPKRSFVEEQSKYADFNAIEQVQCMLQLIIPLGYVILFGGVAPITVPFSFAVFAVSLRAQGFLLCTTTKRPVPSQQYGIGMWHSIVTAVMNLGVLFAGFLLAAYGDMLADQNLITKMSVVVLVMFGIYFLWGIVDIVVPSTTSTITIMAARRKRVVSNLLDISAEGIEALPGATQNSHHFVGIRTASTDAIKNGEWDSIKKTSDAEEEQLVLKVLTIR